MKIFLFFTLFYIPFCGYTQSDSAKLRDIKRLLIASGSVDNAKTTIRILTNSMKNSPNTNLLPADFWENFAKEINYDEILDIYVQIYERNYSHGEILEMLVFYESATGKKMIDKSPQIIGESMSLIREWSKKMANKVNERIKQN